MRSAPRLHQKPSLPLGKPFFPLRRISWALGLVVLTLCTGSVHGEEDPSFNTVRVEGRTYVNLSDFSRFYEFGQNWTRRGDDIKLKNKYRSFQFHVGNRECFVNGVRMWLNDTPIDSRNSTLLSEVDVRKTLHPVLKAWTIPRRKVRTIMIDPGHGGEDRGTSGYRGSLEKRLTLDLAARIEKLLREAGFRTLMTRRSDTYVSLEDRSELANSSEVDMFLSIHFNSAKPSREPKGIETYCLTPVGLSSTGSIRRRLGMGQSGEETGNQYDANNLLLAYLIHQKIVRNITGIEDRGVKRARFFVIKATECPSVLVESGFLSNPHEEKRILSSAFRDQIASAIAEGVKRYAKLMNQEK